MILAIPFPDVDPIAIEIGPLAIRWYALAWIAGFIFGWRYCLMLARRSPWKITRDHIDDFLVWAIIATMVGGRLGYVLFYNPGYYLDHPLQIFAVWRGGMAFHGAIIGLVVAMAIFARRRGLRFLAFGDIIVAAGPIGILLGRIANFINGELFGRPTDVPWAVVFPRGGEVPRHPSQIYEAGLEGLVLFILLWVLATRARALDRPGLVGGAFLVGYALARGTVELFRAPDAHIGFLPGGTTLGQWLTVPMLAFGLYLVARALRRAG